MSISVIFATYHDQTMALQADKANLKKLKKGQLYEFIDKSFFFRLCKHGFSFLKSLPNRTSEQCLPRLVSDIVVAVVAVVVVVSVAFVVAVVAFVAVVIVAADVVVKKLIELGIPFAFEIPVD